MSKKADSNLLKNVAGIAGILIVFVIILRAALTPLYQEVGQMEHFQEQQLAQGTAGNSGGGSSGGSNGSGENINVNLGAPGGWFNWALGWAWSGPGWYRGPDYGSWGANVWNGWRNWQGGNGNNRVWNGTVNDTVNDTHNRAVNNENRSDRVNKTEDDRIRNSGGERREGGAVHENREEPRGGSGAAHGGRK